VVSVTPVRPYFHIYRLEPLLLSSKELLCCTREAEWTPFQTHHFSENPVVPGMVFGILTIRPLRWSFPASIIKISYVVLRNVSDTNKRHNFALLR
jgi:hypothetical protein